MGWILWKDKSLYTEFLWFHKLSQILYSNFFLSQFPLRCVMDDGCGVYKYFTYYFEKENRKMFFYFDTLYQFFLCIFCIIMYTQKLHKVCTIDLLRFICENCYAPIYYIDKLYIYYIYVIRINLLSHFHLVDNNFKTTYYLYIMWKYIDKWWEQNNGINCK